MVEPVISGKRFDQAVNRLEIMRGMKNAHDELFVRMTRKYKIWNMQIDEINGRVLNYRMIDFGADNG